MRHTEMCDCDRCCNRMVRDCLSSQRQGRLHSQRPRDHVAITTSMAHRDLHGQRKVICWRNPQANSMVKRIRQVIGHMMRTRNIRGSKDLDKDFGWSRVLAAVRHAVNSTVHTSNRATPTQLVFNSNAMLNISFEADWQHINEQKQHRILQNNKAEKAKRRDHTCHLGDEAMTEADPSQWLEGQWFTGSHRVTQVHDNGTAQLSQATNGGAVLQAWNICKLRPC